MDFDLFSACIFCSASFFAVDLRPLPGFSGELATGYSTLQRRTHDRSTADESDITMKFVAAGFRFTRPPSGGLGAGTPAAEVAVRAVFPNAHSEQDEREEVPSRVIATGEGRYDNFSGLLRLALAPRTSAEGGFFHRRVKGTDKLTIGDPAYVLTEERQFTAENTSYVLGVRQRWAGLEAAARWEHVVIETKYLTPNASATSRGQINGPNVEVRGAAGRWTGGLGLRGISGTLPVSTRLLPDYVASSPDGGIWMASARLDVSRSFSKMDVFLAVIYEKARLPFVTLATLGAETRAADLSGLAPSTRTEETHVEIALRYRLTEGVLASLFFRGAIGKETVSFVDAKNRAAGTLDVDRGSWKPVSQFLLGASVEFTTGPRPATASR
jgi:hypothetical protein